MNRIIIIAAALCLTAPAAALAAEDVMVVRIGDLNLASDRGAEVALRRIKQAADGYCGAPDMTLRRFRAARQCQDEMIDKAVVALDARRVTALRAAEVRLAQR